MSLNRLTAISPIDGRYASKTEKLKDYFSEAALIKYRILIEVEYFISLCEASIPQLKDFPKDEFENLRKLYKDFSIDTAIRVKEIESVTNHDVKAVEYLIKEEFDKLGLSDFKEFIHFGLTSQDINNTAVPLSIKEAFNNIFFPELKKVKEKLNELSNEWKNVPMLARTHGQAASPTKLGKEIFVFVERIENQIKLLNNIPFSAKFGGATGNFNAHHVSYPEFNWIKFGNDFVNNRLGLIRQQTTTQIEHYDYLAALMDCIKRINNILIDLSRDIWTYISMDYFKQSITKGEVGSSAMPHKVNPIDFENAEGNLGMANAVYEFLSSKLPISRLQRDLTDSTVLRNIGVPFSHNLISFSSLNKGLGKIVLNEEKLHEDLNKNWAVCAEAIQTILRRESYPNPYEALKDLTRTNSTINEESISNFINGLDVSDEVKEELQKISPYNYTGI
ncbi:MAG: adenylosuccinate lyase [Flavobacteriales bacterium]|nr:adenylosuccinate lyase [Flavobacteriales bacterium]|tara:strand:- start:6280 stop:7623 length:1344 start_codon:yes stop_codon:yes gene_type:complete